MYEELNEYINYYINHYSGDYWYDIACEEAIDMVKKFDEEDLKKLLLELPYKSNIWQKRLLSCLPYSPNISLKILMSLTETNDNDLLCIVLEKMIFYNVDLIENYDYIIEKIERLKPNADDRTREIFEYFLNKTKKKSR